MPLLKKAIRVCVIAEAANPQWPSVPLVGWSLSRALAKQVDVHLVTHVRNEEAIIAAGLQRGVNFTAIDNEYVTRPLYKLATRLRGGEGKGWTTVSFLSSIAYYSFEREFWRLFRDRLASGEFDLVHRITPLSPTHQSPIAKKLSGIGVPFVLGPLNGGAPWPKHFREVRHLEKEWLSYMRGLYRMLPAYTATHTYCSAILVGSKHTASELPRVSRSKSVYIPENGVDASLLRMPRTTSVRLRAIFVGRLVPYKGADIVLEAADHLLRGNKLSLDIVGDGPQRADLERYVSEKQIPNVRLHGWVTQGQVTGFLAAADVLAFPSIREFGGGVVLEAMALGVVPVVADYAGPSELVDDNSGIKVPFTDRASLIAGFRAALEKFVLAPASVSVLGEAARKRVTEKLTWDAKARQVVEVYKSVLSRSSLPDPYELKHHTLLSSRSKSGDRALNLGF